jgi:TonB family protein
MRGSIAGPPDTITATATLFPRNAAIFPGESNKSINGNVGPDANAVALGVAGDDAYWLVPALNPDDGRIRSTSTSPPACHLSPALASSPLLQPDPNDPSTLVLPLSYRAVDDAGNFGPTKVQQLYMGAQGVDGTLVVSLDWDAPVDLDLHVQRSSPKRCGLRDCLGQGAQCGAQPPGWRRGRQPGFRFQRGLPDRWARSRERGVDWAAALGPLHRAGGRLFAVWTDVGRLARHCLYPAGNHRARPRACSPTPPPGRLPRRAPASPPSSSTTPRFRNHAFLRSCRCLCPCGRDSPDGAGPVSAERGRGSRQGLRPPKLKKFVEAVYPEDKRAAGTGAKVVLSIEVEDTGRVGNVEVVVPAGPDFDAAAVAAARQFEFEPATLDGAPVPVKIQYAYKFVVKEVLVPVGPQVNFEGVVMDRFTRFPRAGSRSGSWIRGSRRPPTRTVPSPSPTCRPARTPSSCHRASW